MGVDANAACAESAGSSAASVRSGDIWVTVGYGGQGFFPPQTNGGALLHWTGRQWLRQPLPRSFSRYGDPTSVLALSDHDVWVGGGVPDSSFHLTEAVAHWNGSAWYLRKVPGAASTGIASCAASCWCTRACSAWEIASVTRDLSGRGLAAVSWQVDGSSPPPPGRDSPRVPRPKDL